MATNSSIKFLFTTERLEPNENASQRTKNRLKEHPNHTVLQVATSVVGLDGKSGVLIKCADTSWLGWLPTSEVKAVEGSPTN